MPTAQLVTDTSIPMALREAAALHPNLTVAEALLSITNQALATVLLAMGIDISIDKLPDTEPSTSLQEKKTVSSISFPKKNINHSIYRHGKNCGMAILISSIQGPIDGAGIAIWGASKYPIRSRQVEAIFQGRKMSRELIIDSIATLREEIKPGGLGTVTDRSVLNEIERIGTETFLDLFDKAELVHRETSNY